MESANFFNTNEWLIHKFESPQLANNVDAIMDDGLEDIHKIGPVMEMANKNKRTKVALKKRRKRKDNKEISIRYK